MFMLYDNISFDDLLDAFLAEKKVRVRQSTYISYETISRRLIRPYFTGMKVGDIKPGDIRAWQNELLQKGYSERYVRMIDCKLGTIFNYACSFYELPYNPTSRAGHIGTWKGAEMQFWTKGEFERFIAQEERPLIRLAFEILYWTGMREGELLALTPADIHFGESYIDITKTYKRYHGRDFINPPKTGKSKRKIYIHDTLASHIQETIGYSFDGMNIGSNTESSIGSSAAGARIFSFTADMLHGAMKRNAKKAGVKRIRIHDLRHSHASLLIEMNVTPLLVSERLGHEKVETTLNIYSHLYPNKQQELAAKLEVVSRSEML